VTTPYLVDELVIEGRRVIVRAHPSFRSKYLSDDFFVEYGAEVSLEELDDSILAIPFLLNVLPLIWISGDTYRIRSLDAELASALEETREAFRRLYPNCSWDGKLIPDATVGHIPVSDSHEVALLFSGGVDSTHSSLMHRETPQLLITILSSLGLENWWSEQACAAAQTHFRTFSAAFGHRSSFVTSNLCEFIPPTKLVGIWPRPRRWLVEVQHGLGFVGLVAPLMSHMGLRKLLMAGCELDHYGFPGGSHPDIVNSIRWSGVEVSGDGVEKSRQQKLHSICTLLSDRGRRPAVLKPCLRPVGEFENCCKCSKCLQTIVGIIAEGDDPKVYGFEMEPRLVFSALRKQFCSYEVALPDLAELLQWHDIQSAIRIIVHSPRWPDLPVSNRATDLLWFARFDLIQYFVRYQSGFRQAFRKARGRVGLLLDSRPALSKVVRLLLRPFL